MTIAAATAGAALSQVTAALVAHEDRPGQQRTAEAVADAIESGRCLVRPAPTCEQSVDMERCRQGAHLNARACATMTRWDAVHRSAGNRRTATLPDGRSIAWTWQPAGRYPQIITAHVDDELVADRVNADGTITRHADVAAELLRSIGHPDGDAHRPHP